MCRWYLPGGATVLVEMASLLVVVEDPVGILVEEGLKLDDSSCPVFVFLILYNHPTRETIHEGCY